MRRFLVSIIVSCFLALSLGVLLNAEANSNLWTTTSSAVRTLGSRLIHLTGLAPFPTAPDAPELGAPPPPPPPPGPAGDLDQCANGGGGQTPVACTGAAWQNGNLNGNQAHYLEGDSVPYRLRLTGVATGPNIHTVTIAYDTTHSNGGNHALDYLTSFDRTESIADGNNPCSGVTGCSLASFDEEPIPDDPNLPFGVGEDGTPGTGDEGDVPLTTGMMTLFGGDITGIATPFRSLNAKCVTPAPDYSGATVTCVTISFTATASNPVLAWGGHLSTRIDWLPEPSSLSINGSPYHMRLIDVDGSGGNQDRSLSSDAVFFPASLEIIKVTENDLGPISNSDVFSYTTTGTDLFNFTLNTSSLGTSDTQIFSLTDTSTRTVTEDDPSPDYTLTALDCTVTPFPGLNANPAGSATEDLQNRLATITPAEGDAISCTYTNTLQTGTVIINKTAVGGDAEFSYNGTGDGNIPTSFSITTTSGSGSRTFSAVTIGSKTVTEVVPSGWDLTDITCTDPDNGSSVSVSGETATIDVDPGETVTCTFTNTKQAPAIELQKSGSFNDEDGDDLADVGETITYAFTVTNNGNVTLTNVTIDDPKITEQGGPIASLAAGASDSTTFTGTYALTQQDIDAGLVTNTAETCGTPPSGPNVCDTDDHTETLPQSSGLSITKVATEQTYDAVGDVIHYTIVATNTGNTTLLNVVVSDPNVANLVCTPVAESSLAPGAQMSCTADHTITQADIDAGFYENTSCVNATGATQACDTENVPADQNPALDITKTATEENYDSVGDVIHYTIVATNTGNTTLNSVTVSDPDVSGLSCTPANGSALAPGASMTCTATHTVTQADIDAGHYANTACVNAAGATEACDSEDVPADQNPALSITKTATEQSYDSVGDIIHYTIVATNTGNVTLPSVTVTDPNVSGLICKPANGSQLAPGGSMECTATHTVTQDDIDAGHYANTACVEADDIDEPVCADEDVPADQNPEINVVKASTTTLITEPGQVVPYTFTVTNTGNITLTVITVTDPNCDSAPTLDSGDANGNSKLEVTETWIYGCNHTVTAAEIIANGGGDGDLDNNVMADSAETGPDTDDHSIPIAPPNLTITKTPDQAGDTGYEVTAGGVAAFTITVQNIGSGTALGTVLTDTLPSGVGNWTENPDTLCTITGGVSLSCNIGTLAAGASFSVTVQATIPADYLIPPDQGQGTSMFEIDGNLEVTTAGYKDWANAGIDCTSDPKVGCDLDLPSGKTDNAFGQGTKEDSAVPSVVFGAIPNNKSDLIRFYVANERVLSTDFLYLAWERVQAPKGTTNMDFELNQSGTLSANGVTPVRTAGDLLIKFDLDNGGTVPTLGYHKWVTAASAGGQTPAQACEASNSFPCWSKGLALTTSVAAAINEEVVSDPIDPNAPRDLDEVTFGEALIDLQASDIFPEPGDPGFACVSFGQAYLKSRSSSSFTSEIKDFIAPIPIRVSNCAPQDLNNTASVSADNFAGSPVTDTGKINVVPPSSLSGVEGGSDLQSTDFAGLAGTDEANGAGMRAPISSTRRGSEYLPAPRETRLMR